MNWGQKRRARKMGKTSKNSLKRWAVEFARAWAEVLRRRGYFK